MFEDLIFTSYYTSDERSKSDICAELGIRSIVDDNQDKTDGYAKAGMHPVLFGDYPWQTDTHHQHVMRARSWAEVPAAVASQLPRV